MRLIFAGTPEFAAIALQALHTAGHEIALVLTQPDRQAGRGMQLHASAVKQYALTQQMPITQPLSLRLEGKYGADAQHTHALLRAAAAEVMVVAAYGLLLPASVLAIPTYGCLNIHGSLLPRWRGAAPIHRAIEAGDRETGITIMQMDQGLDTGPMLLREKIAISPEDTYGTLHPKMAQLGAQLIVQAIQNVQNQTSLATPQPAQGASYATKISKRETMLDFTLPAAVLARKIRAFNPSPGACATFNNIILKLWQAQAINLAPGAPAGTILQADPHAGILVACGEGALQLTELQKPGAKRLPAREFLHAFPMQGGRFSILPVQT